ncbi:MAG: class I SAM-dependent methyltransferase [Hyphomicrobiaceae bacterium]
MDVIAVYGHMPFDLVEIPPGAIQCSPRVPGASPLGGVATASAAEIIIHAPANVVERQRLIAMALRALAPGAPLTIVAHNTKGGTRLAKELEAFGCEVSADHKHHHKIVRGTRPVDLPARDIDIAIAAGEPRLLLDLGLWSQPGLFNWDRIDPGSALLIANMPVLAGRGADLGCGIGVLARSVRQGGECTAMHLIDIDARALDMARRNVPGDGVSSLWRDVRTATDLPRNLDFVVCNPPFHDAGQEDHHLGRIFIEKAATMLNPRGILWLTANRHLPYEATLNTVFETVEPVADEAGFKVFAARKGAAVKPGDRTGRGRR